MASGTGTRSYNPMQQRVRHDSPLVGPSHNRTLQWTGPAERSLCPGSVVGPATERHPLWHVMQLQGPRTRFVARPFWRDYVIAYVLIGTGFTMIGFSASQRELSERP